MVAANSIITNAGIAAANAAGSGGPLVNIDKFRIGSDSGFTAVVGDTDVHTFVYQGNASQLSYSVIGNNSVLYRITLDQSVGDFAIGNVGLQLDDGTVFALAAYQTTETKTAANPPNTIGNKKSINVIVAFTNIANLISVTINEIINANIPIVDHQTDLPSPNVATSDLYIVRNNTLVNRPTLAVRNAGSWWQDYQSTNAEGDIQGPLVPTSMWDSAVQPGMPVYYERTLKKFIRASNTLSTQRPQGVRGVANDLIYAGKYIDTSTPYITGSVYYCGVTPGTLTANPTGTSYFVGVALTNNQLEVNIGLPTDIPYASEDTAGIVYFATQSEVIAGAIGHKAVSPITLHNKVAGHSIRGLVTLATNSDVDLGTNDTMAITPAGLQSKVGTLVKIGLVRLATIPECQAGVRQDIAVTPAGLKASLPRVPVIRAFISGDLTFPQSLNDSPAMQVAHGLGAKPHIVQIYARAIVNNPNWGVNIDDTIQFPVNADTNDGDGNKGIMWWNSTFVYIATRDTDRGLTIYSKTGHGIAIEDHAESFRLQIQAFIIIP